MKAKIILSSSLLMILALIMSCKKNQSTSNVAQSDNYSSATPVLPANPDNYAVSVNDNLATLGRVLFYDRNLSLNNTVACATCHQQSKAFCDNLQFSVGLEDKRSLRNAPSVFAKNSRMFWDGRASGISDLVLKPVQNHVEMNFSNLSDLVDKLKKIDYYPALFAKAYNGSTSITQAGIREALTEFLLNFNFSDNKFNQSMRNQVALNASETIGKSLFFGKARCSNCHHIESNFNVMPPDSFNFGGGGNGYGSTNESHNIGLDLVYTDNGIGDLPSHDPAMNGMFMIPALLNVEFTAPYMHDGRFKTLDEVVEHYNSGIKNHPNLDIFLRDLTPNAPITPEQKQKYDLNHDNFLDDSEIAQIPPVRLGLSVNEKRALVDFLRTLSDASIFTDKKFSNPFVAAK